MNGADRTAFLVSAASDSYVILDSNGPRVSEGTNRAVVLDGVGFLERDDVTVLERHSTILSRLGLKCRWIKANTRTQPLATCSFGAGSIPVRPPAAARGVSGCQSHTSWSNILPRQKNSAYGLHAASEPIETVEASRSLGSHINI